MTTPYLVLTDGTTTITIANGTAATNYRLPPNGWIPAIAGLRDSALGGRGPYSEVVEEMTLDITGASAAAAYTNLDTLARLLDQAQRWYKGENVSAVLIKYAPVGSAVSSDSTPLQAAILGRAEGDGTIGIGLSPKWHQAGLTYVISGVRVRFVRRGQWLLSTDTAASSATDNGTLADITMAGSLNIPGPTKITLTNFGYGNSGSSQFGPAFIALASASDDIVTRNVESMTATGYTSVSGAARNAKNTNVLRYTPPDTVENPSGTMSGGLATTARLVAVFANIENNSNTTSFIVRLGLQHGDFAYTPKVYIAPYSGSAKPRWEFLGLVAVGGESGNIKFLIQASAASGTLDIDTAVLVNMTRQDTAIIAIRQETGSLISNAGESLIIDHQLLTKPTPIVYVLSSSNFARVYTGDPVIHTTGSHVYALLMGTGKDAASGEFFRQSDSGGTVLQNTWTAVRYTPYLSPR